jgi:pimeloyl-ACP methyl ester carboxylesterase
MTPATQFLTRHGRRIAYDRQGDGGIPLVFVHGWTTNRRGFAPQVEHFAPAHTVVTVDLRGHGESDPADSYEVSDFADDVLWVCEALGLDHPVLVGHSLGGMIVTEAAAVSGDRLGAIVALDSPFVATEYFSGAVDHQIAVFGRQDRAEEARGLLEAYLQGPYDDHAARALDFEGMLSVPPEVGVPALRSIAGWPARRSLLKVTVPVLAVHAPAGALADTAALTAGMPNVFTAQTVGSGHFIQNEVPEQVNAMIDRFLTVIVAPARH